MSSEPQPIPQGQKSGMCFSCKQKQSFIPTEFKAAANKSTQVAIGNCPRCSKKVSTMISNKLQAAKQAQEQVAQESEKKDKSESA